MLVKLLKFISRSCYFCSIAACRTRYWFVAVVTSEFWKIDIRSCRGSWYNTILINRSTGTCCRWRYSNVGRTIKRRPRRLRIHCRVTSRDVVCVVACHRLRRSTKITAFRATTQTRCSNKNWVTTYISFSTHEWQTNSFSNKIVDSEAVWPFGGVIQSKANKAEVASVLNNLSLWSDFFIE